MSSADESHAYHTMALIQELGDETFDPSLTCNDPSMPSIRVHRVIATAHSALIRRNCPTEAFYNLPHLPYETIQWFKEFIYSGKYTPELPTCRKIDMYQDPWKYSLLRIHFEMFKAGTRCEAVYLQCYAVENIKTVATSADIFVLMMAVKEVYSLSFNDL